MTNYLSSVARNHWEDLSRGFGWFWIGYRHINDYDYASILKVMEYEMTRMSSHIQEHGHLVGSEKVVKELKICSTLCKRIRLNEYGDERLHLLDKKFGPLKFRSRMENGVRYHYIGRAWANTSEREAMMHRLTKKVMNLNETDRKNELHLLVKYMDRRLFNWWD